MTNFYKAETKEITSCGITPDSANFQSVAQFPALPLTEAFGKFDKNFPNFDQELLMSMTSGHVQLKYQIDPAILYNTNNYAFRSDLSLKSDKELQILLDFLKQHTQTLNCNHVLEIGANDLTFSKRLKEFFTSVSACDPLLVQDHGKSIDGIKIIGLPIEKAIDEVANINPDLIIARHTLEHISNPRLLLLSLLESASEKCIFIFEVPSLMHIGESLRFDAIFHQHYHYFDLHSVQRLLMEVGGELLNYTFNNQGSNGGSLIFSFRKSSKQFYKPTFNLEKKFHWLSNRFRIFNKQMEIIINLLDDLPAPIFGYGAGLMLATLNYHLGGRLENLNCVLDDDSEKDGLSYKNVRVNVQYTGKFEPPAQSSFIITSLESIRPIYNRISQFNPRRIIVPPIS